MIEIKRENDDIVLRFPKRLVSDAYLEKFIKMLELEEFAAKNKMTEEQAWQISEDIKQSWWEKNKDKFLEDIK